MRFARGFAGGLVAAGMLFALVAAPRPARADSCSVQDLSQSLSDAYHAISPSCLSQADDPFFWGLTAYLAAAVQTPAYQQFCSDMKDLDKAASDFSSKATSYWNKLTPDQQQSIKDNFPDIAKALQQGATDLGAALKVVSCACQVATDHGFTEVSNVVGDCINDALCAVDDWLSKHISSDFQSCSGPPPTPPQQINCTVTPQCVHNPNGTWTCTNLGAPVVGGDVAYSETQQALSLLPNDFDNNGAKCLGGQCNSGVDGFECVGDWCFGGNNYCYCPQVMQHAALLLQDATADNGQGFMRCACPAGTQALGASGAPAYICMCPSGQPVNDDGTCPPACNPSCAGGQVVNVSDLKSCTFTCSCPSGQTLSGGKCVTPCADSSQILLASGACCAPSQASSCGTCCPLGMRPDDLTGGCTSDFTPGQKPQQTLTPGQIPKTPPKGP